MIRADNKNCQSALALNECCHYKSHMQDLICLKSIKEMRPCEEKKD